MTLQKQEIVLSPAQQHAFQALLSGKDCGDVLLLKARPGSGRSTVLSKLQKAIGGVLLGIRAFVQSLSAQRPEAIEEAFLQMIEQALAHHQIVMIDDLHLVTRIVSQCDYPRTLIMDAALTALVGEAGALRKKLVFTSDDDVPWPLARRAYTGKIPKFEPEDYDCICRAFLRETGEPLDFARIHRFAPALTAGQLRYTCSRLSRAKSVDTQTVIDYLRSQV